VTSHAPDADPDAALVAALSRGHDQRLDRDDLAARSGLPVAVIEALERQDLLRPDEDGRYSEADLEVLDAGRTLLDSGIPLGELLDLAKRVDASLRAVAEAAVDTFVRYIRDPAHAGEDEEMAAGRLTDAFERMLPASSRLVGEHFGRLVVEQARLRATGEVDPDGDPPGAT
jgi:DNA-binding transcriptional MerR regulator